MGPRCSARSVTRASNVVVSGPIAWSGAITHSAAPRPSPRTRRGSHGPNPSTRQATVVDHSRERERPVERDGHKLRHALGRPDQHPRLWNEIDVGAGPHFLHPVPLIEVVTQRRRPRRVGVQVPTTLAEQRGGEREPAADVAEARRVERRDCRRREWLLGHARRDLGLGDGVGLAGPSSTTSTADGSGPLARTATSSRAWSSQVPVSPAAG